MAFAGMQDGQARLAPGGQQQAIRLDCLAQLGNIVAQHLAEAAGLEEVALHVEDEQRALLGDKGEGIRLRLDLDGTLFDHAGPSSAAAMPPLGQPTFIRLATNDLKSRGFRHDR